MAQQTLLERQAYLDALDETLRDVAETGGGVALVSGEAGIGKTSLLEQFVPFTGRHMRSSGARATPSSLPHRSLPFTTSLGRMRHPLGDLLLRERATSAHLFHAARRVARRRSAGDPDL